MVIDIEELCRKAYETDVWEDNDAAYYALGCLKPHYPVPAIRYKLEYQISRIDGRVTHLWQWASGYHLVKHWKN